MDLPAIDLVPFRVTCKWTIPFAGKPWETNQFGGVENYPNWISWRMLILLISPVFRCPKFTVPDGHRTFPTHEDPIGPRVQEDEVGIASSTRPMLRVMIRSSFRGSRGGVCSAGRSKDIPGPREQFLQIRFPGNPGVAKISFLVFKTEHLLRRLLNFAIESGSVHCEDTDMPDECKRY